ncbi:MAG: S8 family serine peptidase [Pseudonocardia sp.]
MTPPVLAEAVVRARDGRSAADWVPGGAEPARAFVADPDRLHRAMTMLEDLGLTVTGAGRATLSFHGPAEVVTAAFGVPLTAAPAPDGPEWRTGSGATSFDVAAGPLDGVLHRVHLRAPAGPRARRAGVWELFTSDVEDIHDDFLVGETFATLVRDRHRPAGPPDPVHQPHPAGFPPTRAAEALAQTRAAFAGPVDPASTRPESVVCRQVVAGQHPGTVAAVVVETDAGPRLRDTFRSLLLDQRGRVPLRVTGTRDPVGDINVRHFADVRDSVWVTEFRAKVKPAWREVVRARMALTAALGAPDTGARRAGFDALRDRFGAFVTAAAPLGTAMGLAAPWVRVDPVLDRIDGETDLLTAAVPAGPAPAAWGDLVDVLAAVRRWVDDRTAHYVAAERQARIESQEHAAMTASAFLAVTRRHVPVELHQVRDPFATGLRIRPPTGVRTVVSCSFGQSAKDGFDSPTVRTDLWELAACPAAERERLVRVYPSGNDEGTAVPDTIAAHAADRSHNVLVVGGCAPVGDHWEACPATHGYTITLPGAAPVTLPHVCATTKAATGGSVLFPHPDVQRWWTGSGSSLAVPIVAAVCALVWGYHPGLPGDEIVAAVVEGADTVTAGSFTPTVASGAGYQITPGSQSAAVNPARPVLLAPAISAAARAVARRLSAQPPQHLLTVVTAR